eukprot:COSAG01_NODE_8048_length_2940_cov_193.142555_1_plen_579_part_10
MNVTQASCQAGYQLSSSATYECLSPHGVARIRGQVCVPISQSCDTIANLATGANCGVNSQGQPQACVGLATFTPPPSAVKDAYANGAVINHVRGAVPGAMSVDRSGGLIPSAFSFTCSAGYYARVPYIPQGMPLMMLPMYAAMGQMNNLLHMICPGGRCPTWVCPVANGPATLSAQICIPVAAGTKYHLGNATANYNLGNATANYHLGNATANHPGKNSAPDTGRYDEIRRAVGLKHPQCTSKLNRCLANPHCAAALTGSTSAALCFAPRNQLCTHLWRCLSTADPCRDAVEACLSSKTCAAISVPSDQLISISNDSTLTVVTVKVNGSFGYHLGNNTVGTCGTQRETLCEAVKACHAVLQLPCNSTHLCPANFFCSAAAADANGTCQGCTSCSSQTGWCTGCGLSNFGRGTCMTSCLLHGPIPCVRPNREDRCGQCDADPSNDCTIDCSGSFAKATDPARKHRDVCGVCGGDQSTCMDCNNTFNGKARRDRCGTCDEHPANDCTRDCAGIWGGVNDRDGCSVCGGDNSTCTDCAGVPNGNASVDRCNVCDADPSNDCVKDCAGRYSLPPGATDPLIDA